jgi:cytochrome c peroxidase
MHRRPEVDIGEGNTVQRDRMAGVTACCDHCRKPLRAGRGVAGPDETQFDSVTCRNAYVANTQMHGKGTFFDPRLNNAAQFPVAAKSRVWNKRDTPDLITSKLAALHYYQLSIPAPEPPRESYNADAAARGKVIFEGKGKCATCHVPPLFTEPGWSMHAASEIGIDEFQSSRSPDKKFYRTTPLKGLFTRAKGGFYHDGRFADLNAIVDHYRRVLNVELSASESADLVEYLKSL